MSINEHLLNRQKYSFQGLENDIDQSDYCPEIRDRRKLNRIAIRLIFTAPKQLGLQLRKKTELPQVVPGGACGWIFDCLLI
jgi:hypothetical protein